jgi:hypothetical protein
MIIGQGDVLLFRDALKPGVAPMRRRRSHGYQAVLRHQRSIVWRGDSFLLRDFGSDARPMAMDAAEAVLHCDDGSLTAEQLQRIVDQRS